MKVLNKYNVFYQNLEDELIVFSPDNDLERKEMFKFRYDIYLKHNYIDINKSKLDIDDYDREIKNIIYINVLSVVQSKIIGSVRIIFSDPLPIMKDCFDFKEPLIIKKFSNGNKAEISRLIINRYKDNTYLPRHLVMLIIIKEILNITKSKNINFVYSFVKLSLLKKLQNIHFPLLKIKKYEQKYKGGVLNKYFDQSDNPVIPIYFIRQIVRVYMFIIFFKFKKYIC